MEIIMKTSDKFKFPHYEAVCWYAAVHLVEEMKDMAATGTKIPQCITTGIRALVGSLRHWEAAIGVPPGVNSVRLLKDLLKEQKVREDRTAPCF